MVENDTEGRQRFSFYRSHAESVELVGTFTDWLDHPIEMTRGDDGWWRADSDLPPGDYEFGYLVNRREWANDYAASGVEPRDDGSFVSLLFVPQRHAPLPITVRTQQPATQAASIPAPVTQTPQAA